MASATSNIPLEKDWILGNPWPWMGLGIMCSGSAYVLSFMEADPSPARYLLVLLGLLCGGGALVLRLGSSKPSSFDRASRSMCSLVHTGLMVVFAALALAVTATFLLRVFGIAAITYKPGLLFLLWGIVAPVSCCAVLACFRRIQCQDKVKGSGESALMLVLAGGLAYLSSWALYHPDLARDCDTLRLLLRMAAGTSLVAAPAMLVSQSFRRCLVSGLILFHFGGICTAALAAPPTPWIVTQLWARIYQPYLDFMYLNNAYHFYAPEPGAASLLWFRLIYEDDQHREYGVWHKVPNVDQRGYHQYRVSLEYQRFLAIGQNSEPSQSTSLYEMKKVEVAPGKFEARMGPATFYANRMMHTPAYDDKKAQDEQIVGIPVGKFPADRLRIPFHPQLLGNFFPLQYQKPTNSIQMNLESHVRHVAQVPHPDRPDLRIKTIKVYRVVHLIPQFGLFVHGMDPQDPEFFRPYFMGDFDPQGKLLTLSEDPFLYWLLPIMRELPGLEMPVKNYAYKHAGDPNWVYHPREKEWKEN